VSRREDMKMLAEDLAKYYDDPYGYVMWAFPWRREGTTLEKFSGPRPWQKEFLVTLGMQIKARHFDGVNPVSPILMARASGHGIGKSALTAWLIKFILDTRPNSKGVVTANTSDQLRTKTWGELAKWHNMSVTKSLFEYKNSRGNMSLYNIDSPETWRCDALTCREENSESFAGLHAATATPFFIFDEASAIPEKIHEVAQGGLTDGEPMWFQFGNPTRNTGFFRRIFSQMKRRWLSGHIDSRDVEGTNKEVFRTWIEDYGIDSDFVRVRVTGQFPRAAVCQFIPNDIVEAAMGKHLPPSLYDFAPKILGVDVAWYGDDRSVIWYRQGLMSKRLWSMREVDSITTAGIVGQYEDELQTDATFVDAGVGTGVIDQLRRLGRNPIPVWFGGKPLIPKYHNKRAEMWGEMKDWLELGSAIPKEQSILDDLTGPEYHMTLLGKIQLERKEDMKKRGLSSPDDGDGLALTFGGPVIAKSEFAGVTGDPCMAEMDYDLFGG